MECGVANVAVRWTTHCIHPRTGAVRLLVAVAAQYAERAAEAAEAKRLAKEAEATRAKVKARKKKKRAD